MCNPILDRLVHAHCHVKKIWCVEKKVHAIARKWKIWKDLESIKTTFNWKHFIINRIKNGSFETHRHSLKMNWFRNEHWWNVQCFQNLLYQLSNELISNHDTILLLICAVDLRSINPSAWAFERMVTCSSQLTCWSRCKSRSHCKPRWRRACEHQC